MNIPPATPTFYNSSRHANNFFFMEVHHQRLKVSSESFSDEYQFNSRVFIHPSVPSSRKHFLKIFGRAAASCFEMYFLSSFSSSSNVCAKKKMKIKEKVRDITRAAPTALASAWISKAQHVEAEKISEDDEKNFRTTFCD